MIMIDFEEFLKNLFEAAPSAVRINGKLYNVKLEEVKEEELIDADKLKKELDDYIDSIDPEIYEDTMYIFSKKYNYALFNKLLEKDKLTKDEFAILKNAKNALADCVLDAARARINYLNDKYFYDKRQAPEENSESIK